MLKKNTLICVILLSLCNLCYSQSITPFVIASTGSFSTSANFTLSSTLGEVMVTTATGTNNILTQGFQQPSSMATYVQQIDEGETSITVYPNPATDHLTVEISSDKYDRFDIEIFDLPGRKMFTRYKEDQYSTTNGSATLTTGIYTINTSALAEGIYLLRITSSNLPAGHAGNEFQKVIKINKLK